MKKEMNCIPANDWVAKALESGKFSVLLTPGQHFDSEKNIVDVYGNSKKYPNGIAKVVGDKLVLHIENPDFIVIDADKSSIKATMTRNFGTVLVTETKDGIFATISHDAYMVVASSDTPYYGRYTNTESPESKWDVACSGLANLSPDVVANARRGDVFMFGNLLTNLRSGPTKKIPAPKYCNVCGKQRKFTEVATNIYRCENHGKHQEIIDANKTPEGIEFITTALLSSITLNVDPKLMGEVVTRELASLNKEHIAILGQYIQSLVDEVSFDIEEEANLELEAKEHLAKIKDVKPLSLKGLKVKLDRTGKRATPRAYENVVELLGGTLVRDDDVKPDFILSATNISELLKLLK